MQPLDWTILLLAALLIAATIWFFFAHRDPVAQAASASGKQEIEIQVRGGYTPSAIRAKAGVPLTLVFDRQDKSSCSEEIVLSDFGIRRFLPSFEKTRIDIPSPKPGTYQFTCGMGMLHGTLIVE